MLAPHRYLNEGLSLIVTAVTTILLNSFSSDAAIKTILGILAKYAISKDPA